MNYKLKNQGIDRVSKKSLRGSLLLLLGAVIWGAAFVAQRVGMDHMGPFTFNGIRMLLAWLVMIPVTALFERKNKKAQGYTAPDPKEQRLSGVTCGALLFIASSLQQMGLVSTSPGYQRIGRKKVKSNTTTTIITSAVRFTRMAIFMSSVVSRRSLSPM